jgi:hypothetical protein
MHVLGRWLCGMFVFWAVRLSEVYVEAASEGR